MKVIKIKKYWFVSAGMKYGWNKDGLDCKGVGIRMSDMKTNKMIKIEIVGENYLLESEKGLAFVAKYNSIFVASGSVEIGVISKSLLRQLTSPGEEKSETSDEDEQALALADAEEEMAEDEPLFGSVEED